MEPTVFRPPRKLIYIHIQDNTTRAICWSKLPPLKQTKNLPSENSGARHDATAVFVLAWDSGPSTVLSRERANLKLVLVPDHELSNVAIMALTCCPQKLPEINGSNRICAERSWESCSSWDRRKASQRE